ncbi:hypothetical protein WDJ50_02540 [Deinococcus sp. VB142]|uniref:Uncharacterized protein n=1 Tax=Deinococcus sp. VB142 TaxID=3112952 RepID=A0AAU6Q321_9DEIO
MKYYPGYRWRDVLEESSLVLSALYLEIPDIHLKRAWPTMQLLAFVGNALGGKQSGGEKMDARKMFSPEDFPPPFALGAAPPPPLEPQHCYAFIEALEHEGLSGASWVIQMVEIEDDLERIRAVGVGYGELLDRVTP